uniref:DUF4346 domain-containing protein n=1 Tax=Polysiphonia scopulorum TaxID=257860 RepID=A0A1Z1MIB2_9FLOR|nr:hypothetical protein [Polysiphonia scopulorum]ARW65555.1 hypothetical protein [Polysiphonia scopulorum]
MNSSYILIKVSNNEKIEVYYFNNGNRFSSIYNYPVCFFTYFKNIDQLFVVLSLFNGVNVLSTQHKLYLGKEIHKAQLSILMQQIYIQA